MSNSKFIKGVVNMHEACMGLAIHMVRDGAEPHMTFSAIRNTLGLSSFIKDERTFDCTKMVKCLKPFQTINEWFDEVYDQFNAMVEKGVFEREELAA